MTRPAFFEAVRTGILAWLRKVSPHRSVAHSSNSRMTHPVVVASHRARHIGGADSGHIASGQPGITIAIAASNDAVFDSIERVVLRAPITKIADVIVQWVSVVVADEILVRWRRSNKRFGHESMNQNGSRNAVMAHAHLATARTAESLLKLTQCAAELIWFHAPDAPVSGNFVSVVTANGGPSFSIDHAATLTHGGHEPSENH